MKSQTGLETLFVIGLVIVVLVFAVVSYISKGTEVDFAKRYLEAQKICFEIKNIINQVTSDGFGIAVKFNVPKKLVATDYNLSIDSESKTITISWDNNSFSCNFLTQNVTNSTHGKFFLNKVDNVAKNSDGIVIIK